METLFIGQNLIRLPACDSTNSVLMQLATQNDFLAEGSVLITDHQTAGRGQRGNAWEAQAGENLTFSVLLKPTFLHIDNIFSLNILVALAVREALQEVLLEQNFQEKDNFLVKWANDILYKKQKIGGILIENTLRGSHIQNSIVGIGININQVMFEYENATSLAKIISKKVHLKFNLEYILHKILKHLEYYYLCIKKGDFAKQKQEYFTYLFQYNIWTNYELPNGEVFLGKIVDVSQEGYIEIQTEEMDTKYFGLKELKFLY